MLQGYSCPITTRTNLIQPYDIPRFVGEIIRQLHEISVWTSKCATVLNSQNTPPPPVKASPVPATLVSEMELLKKNLNVVEKQQANKLVSEIAYLQCALRCEADEKLLAFEHFVEKKLEQCVLQQTMQLEERQKQLESRVQSVEDTCCKINDQTKDVYHRLEQLEEMVQSNAANTSQLIMKLHTECMTQSKLREKSEATLGNQMTQTRLHIQDALGLLKGSHEQLAQKVDAVKTELKDAIEHVRKNILAHEKLLNRIARGPVGFEGAKTTVPLAKATLKTRPASAYPSSRGIPAPSNQLMHANATLPSPKRVESKGCDELKDLPPEPLKEICLQDQQELAIDIPQTPKLEIPPCYMLDDDRTPKPTTNCCNFSLQTIHTIEPPKPGQLRCASFVNGPAIGDKVKQKECTTKKEPIKLAIGKTNIGFNQPKRPTSARPRPTQAPRTPETKGTPTSIEQIISERNKAL